jgi:phosphinothricin acetyltransferase
VRLTVRSAVAADVPALTDLYNHYVTETPITFDLVPWSVEQRHAWFEHYSTEGRHRLLVADLDGEVVGYATSSRFRDKAAYETSVEATVYCRHDLGGRGIGTALYGELFAVLAGEDVHRAYAGITLPNDASVALHRRFGFADIGVYREVGRKFGRYWDVLWQERPVP